MAMQQPHMRAYTLAFGLSLIVVLFAGLSLSACSSENKADKLQKQGVLLYKNHKYFNAIKKFEEALEIAPDNVSTLTMAADAYLQTGKPTIAIEYAERAIALDPERYSAFLTMGKAHLDLAISDPTTTSTAATTETLATRKPNQEEIKAAAKIAQMLREKQPDSPEGLILQAKIDVLNGKFEAAQRLYEKAVELSADNVDAKLGLCDVLIIQKKYGEAIKVINPMVEGQKSPNPMAVTQMAMALMGEKEYAKAFNVLKPWVDEKNLNPILNQYLLAGNILISEIQSLKSIEKAKGNGSPDETTGLDIEQQAELNTALDNLALLGGVMKGRYPTRPESYYFRAISHEMMGSHEEAVTHFRQAIQRAPESRQYRMALAISLLAAKNFEEARQQLRLILRNAPGDMEARLRMAQCFIGENSYDQALSLLETLHRERPDMPIITSLLGNLLKDSKNEKDVERGIELLNSLPENQNLPPGSAELARAQAAIQEGRNLASEGQPRQADEKFMRAEELLRQAQELQPENAIIELQLAELAQLRNDLLSALIHTRNAVQIDPKYKPLEAQLFTRLGQYNAARAIYEKLLEEYPDNISFHMAIADLLVRQRQSDDAIIAYDSLIESYPDDPQAYLNKASLLANLDRRDEAIDLLQAQTGKFTDNIPLRLALARMQLQELRTGDAEQNLAAMAQTVENSLNDMEAQNRPDSELTRMRTYIGAIHLTQVMTALLDTNYDKVGEQAELAIQNDPSLTSQARIFQAVALIHQDQAGQALDQLSGIADRKDLPPSFPYLVSLTHLATGDKSIALETIGNQPGLDPDTLTLYQQLINDNPLDKLKAVVPDLMIEIFLAERITYAQVVLMLADQTLQVLPDSPMLLARKAETLQLMGRVDEALKTYDHIEKIMPELVVVKIAKARIYKAKYELAFTRGDKAQADENVQKATESLQQMLQANPKSVTALQSLADLAQKQGELEKANIYYRQTIEIDPANWAAYNNLAWNLSESGDLDQAAEIGHKALELVPGVGVVQDTVGWIEFQRNNIDDAVKLLKDASLRIPNNPEVRFHLARALEEHGDTQDAITELETLMLATPGFDQISEVRDLLAKLSPDSALLK